METKRNIRKKCLYLRSLLSKEQWEQKSLQIQEKVMDTVLYKEADTVLLYIDYHDEVSTAALLEDCLEKGKTVACPKVLADGEMEFFRIRGTEDLTEGYKGIREPSVTDVCEPKQALVIVPGVAFDQRGYRIGYGKGFYDRYLKRHPSYSTIALAFQCQIVERIEEEEHDICMNMVITE